MKAIIRNILITLLIQLIITMPIDAKSSTLRGLLAGATSGAILGKLIGGPSSVLYSTVGVGASGTLIGADKDIQRKKNRHKAGGEDNNECGNKCKCTCMHELPANHKTRNHFEK